MRAITLRRLISVNAWVVTAITAILRVMRVLVTSVMDSTDESGGMGKVDRTDAEWIDLRGLNCPEPVMMLHVHFRRLLPGAEIWVVTTDPTTVRDVPKFCHFLGHELLVQRAVSQLPAAPLAENKATNQALPSEAAQPTASEAYYLFHIRKALSQTSADAVARPSR